MAELELVLFRRQYRQLFELDFISWPPTPLLRSDDAQIWLFRNLFDISRNKFLPPPQYQLLILERLIRRIQSQDVYLPLINHLEHLKQLSQDDVSTATGAAASQVEAHITFTCLPPDRSTDATEIESTITLRERRDRVVGSSFTGFRTWDGCLHLASYLLTERGRNHVEGKNILELGAGTGLLSILCSKHINAKHVLSTDGDGDVVEALRENSDLNRDHDRSSLLEDLTPRVLFWGEELKGTWVEEECRKRPIDVVLGADITYHKDAVVLLAFTLNEIVKLQPHVEIIIASVVRRAESFEIFLAECRRFGLTIEEIDFQAKPIREQKALFYAAAMPLKILKILGTRP